MRFYGEMAAAWILIRRRGEMEGGRRPGGGRDGCSEVEGGREGDGGSEVEVGRPASWRDGRGEADGIEEAADEIGEEETTAKFPDK
jgi:hypothetical protein